MTKQKNITLSIKLLIVIISGIALVIVVFLLNRYLITLYLDNIYMSEDNIKKRNEKHIEDFATYVRDNDIKASDMKSILRWQENEDDVYIFVYQNDKLVYDSAWWKGTQRKNPFEKFEYKEEGSGDVVISESEKKEILRRLKLKRNKANSTEKVDKAETKTTEEASTQKDSFWDFEKEISENISDTQIPLEAETEAELKDIPQYGYSLVKFEDGVFDVCVFDYSESAIYNFAIIISFVFCCILLIAIIVVYHRKEINRVIRLTNEVKSIKETDISNPISLNGRDEIYELSVNIDSMRNTIIDKMGKEKAAWQANSDLVTAMAHDIRTPLTVMSGYLELIKNKEYSSEEELMSYINISADKAEQLKTLSDKLFRYFYVYSKSEDNIVLEEYDAKSLLDQIIGEYVILLEDSGYTFDIMQLDDTCVIKVDIQLFKRLIDNLFTNITKYADKDRTIKITQIINRNKLKIRIKNKISNERNKAESTRIGLSVCKKIAEQMKGIFYFEEKGENFTACIELPAVKTNK